MPFEMELSNVRCIIEGKREIPCATYISKELSSTECNVDVTYYYDIQNIGRSCKHIESINTSIGNQVYTLPSGLLPDYERQFCPENILTIVQEQKSIDICEFRGTEKIFGITINDDNTAYENYLLPFTDYLGPVTKPTPTVPPSPDNGLCKQSMETMILNYSKSTCDKSSHLQAESSWRNLQKTSVLSSEGKRRKSGKVGNRSKSGKTGRHKEYTHFSCTDYSVDSTEIIAYVEVMSSDGKETYFKGRVSEGRDILVKGSKANDGRISSGTRIKIYDMINKGPKLIQEVTFNTSCSKESLYLSDRFGSIQVVGFTNPSQHLIGRNAF